MMNRWIFVFGILIWTSLLGVIAQNPVSDFQIYQVKQGDALIKIIKQFKTCRAELLALNPELKDPLEAGLSLIVPKSSAIEALSDPSTDLLQHKVKRKETLFGKIGRAHV